LQQRQERGCCCRGTRKLGKPVKKRAPAHAARGETIIEIDDVLIHGFLHVTRPIIVLARAGRGCIAETQDRAALYFISASWQNRNLSHAGRSAASVFDLVRGCIPIWPAHVLDFAP
jgi:hypothetical protein